MWIPGKHVLLGCVQRVDSPAAPSSVPCWCRCDRMCLRVSSSCVSCPIRICSFWFSSCNCMALCWVSRILLRALSRLFLTAMLFLSRRMRYSALSLLMLLLVTGARRVGRRKGEKSCRWEYHTCLSYGEEWWSFILGITLRQCVKTSVSPVECWYGSGGGLCSLHSKCCWDRSTCTAGTTFPSSAQPLCHHRPPWPVPETDCTRSCPSELADWLNQPCWKWWGSGSGCGSGCGADLGMSSPTPGWQRTPWNQTSVEVQGTKWDLSLILIYFFC